MGIGCWKQVREASQYEKNRSFLRLKRQERCCWKKKMKVRMRMKRQR